MANRNTRRRRKAIAKAFSSERKAGRKITPPVSRRRSKWRGVSGNRQTVANIHGFRN